MLICYYLFCNLDIIFILVKFSIGIEIFKCRYFFEFLMKESWIIRVFMNFCIMWKISIFIVRESCVFFVKLGYRRENSIYI